MSVRGWIWGASVGAVLMTLPASAAPKKKPPGKPGKPTAEVVFKLPAAPGATLAALPKGLVVLRGGKKVDTAGPGFVLKEGDVITTAEGQTTDLRLGDQAVVQLQPRSKLTTTTLLKPDPNAPEEQATQLHLDFGTVLVRLRALRGKSRFVIDTPSAVTAAKGTAYLVEVGANDTAVLVQEGAVGLALPANPGQELAVPAGQKAAVTAGALPAATEPLTEADRARLAPLQQLQLPVLTELGPLIGQLDGLLQQKRYADAERLAAFVVNRGWGTRDGVRAYTRLMQSLRERTGSARRLGSEGDEQVLIVVAAWQGWPPAPDAVDRERWREYLSRVIAELREDQLARHWILVGLAHTRDGRYLEANVATCAELEAVSNGDPAVRSACRWALAVSIWSAPPTSRTADQVAQAGRWFEELAAGSGDEVDRDQALLRLLNSPESTSPRKLKRKETLEEIATRAARQPHTWGYWHLATAYLGLGKYAEAAAPATSLYTEITRWDPSGRTVPGFAFAVAERLADRFQRQNQAPAERQWRRLIVEHLPNTPPDVLARNRQRLAQLGP